MQILTLEIEKRRLEACLNSYCLELRKCLNNTKTDEDIEINKKRYSQLLHMTLKDEIKLAGIKEKLKEAREKENQLRRNNTNIRP